MMTLARFSWAVAWPEGPGLWDGVGKRLQDVPTAKGSGESWTVVILKLGLSGEMKEDMPGRGKRIFLSSLRNIKAWIRSLESSSLALSVSLSAYEETGEICKG